MNVVINFDKFIEFNDNKSLIVYVNHRLLGFYLCHSKSMNVIDLIAYN